MNALEENTVDSWLANSGDDTVAAYQKPMREEMEACLNCLGTRVIIKTDGPGNKMHTVQCAHCGFNVTRGSLAAALRQWNGFKVWTLVPQEKKP